MPNNLRFAPNSHRVRNRYQQKRKHRREAHKKPVPPSTDEFKAFTFLTAAASSVEEKRSQSFSTTLQNQEVIVFNSTLQGMIKMVCEGVGASAVCLEMGSAILEQCKDMVEVSISECTSVGKQLLQLGCSTFDGSVEVQAQLTLSQCNSPLGNPNCAVTTIQSKCGEEEQRLSAAPWVLLGLFSFVVLGGAIYYRKSIGESLSKAAIWCKRKCFGEEKGLTDTPLGQPYTSL